MAYSSVSLVYALCTLLWICSTQTVLMESLHLQYYTHEIRGGPNATLLVSAGADEGGNFSSLGWGSFVVFDNIIRETFSPDSTVLGTITGTTVVTGKSGGWPLQFMAQILFTENSTYNGSSFTVIPGLLIAGGTGCFQGCTGYGHFVEVSSTPRDSGEHVYLWNVYLESKQKH